MVYDNNKMMDGFILNSLEISLSEEIHSTSKASLSGET